MTSEGSKKTTSIENTLLVVSFDTVLTPEEKQQWLADLASLTDFNEKIKIKFFDKSDEAVYAIQQLDQKS